MSIDGEPAILWITAEGERSSALAAEVAPAVGAEIEVCPSRQFEERLVSMNVSGAPPAAVVIDENLPAPLSIARIVYRLAPQVHILFLVERESTAEFRRQMSPAPMIGTNWSIVEPRPGTFEEALAAAVRANSQRRHLRTSLAHINMRLNEERPTRDSAEYRKLVISDKYLASILEHAKDGVLSVDLDGRIVSWNRGAADLFGYQVERVAGMSLDRLEAPGQGERLKQWFEQAKRGTPTVQCETDMRREDAQPFAGEVTVAPIRSDTGEVMAVSLTVRDISERKRNQEELMRIRAELEQRVAQRTAALRAVNRELEAFTYSASHDLRAPLRGIDGFSQALLEDYGNALDETAGHYIARIRSAARRMGETIDALLMLSRITQAPLKLETIDLSGLAVEIVTELRERDPRRRLELEVEPGLLARADSQLIRIALENLLGNAWKFTRERERARIVVGRSASGPPGTYYVRDNGAGFDMAYADKLFLPFQRLHDPERFPGTGIGLGTVQRVIARHGGRVWAEGAPGEGATFYFSLPEGVADRAGAEP
jgi:PAS domain S-box-containing protein